MNLKIEQGVLLKPYLAPYTRKDDGGHRIRPGWTPDRTPAMQGRFDELRAEPGDTPDFLLWKQVEHERGQQLVRRKRPYPGWFPVRPKSDKAISKAYRELFVRMNPDADKRIRVGNVWSGEKAKYPPDGDYVLEGGVMRPVTDEHGISAPDVKDAVGGIVGGMVRGATVAK